MLNLNDDEKKQQERLIAYIRKNFTQKDFATLWQFIATALNLDIQSLSFEEATQKINHAIKNIDPEEADQRILTVLMKAKNQQEVTTEEKTPAERVSTRRPKKFVSPVDKLSQVLFDTRKNSQFYDDALEGVKITVGSVKKKPVQISVSLDIEKLRPYITLDTDAMLNPENRVIHDAVISLYDGKNTHFTADMIYHFLNGYSRLDKAPEGARAFINEAITKLMYTGITIDAREEAQAFGIKDFQFKGYLLPVTYTKATINGTECECWKILDTPPLLALADRKGQINRETVNRLDTGLNFTPENITIIHYLLNQILTMKNPNSDRNSTILYASLNEYLNIHAPTEATAETIRRRVRKKVKTILDAWTESGFISGYDEVLNGKKIIGLHIKYKKKY